MGHYWFSKMLFAMKCEGPEQLYNSTDLNELGVIDGIIPEITGSGHRNVAKQALYVKEYISVTLKALNTLNAKIHEVYSNKS